MKIITEISVASQVQLLIKQIVYPSNINGNWITVCTNERHKYRNQCYRMTSDLAFLNSRFFPVFSVWECKFSRFCFAHFNTFFGALFNRTILLTHFSLANPLYCDFCRKSSQDNSNSIFAMEYVTAFRIIHSRSARFRTIATVWSSDCDHATSTARPRKDAKCRDIFHREDGIWVILRALPRKIAVYLSIEFCTKMNLKEIADFFLGSICY